MAPFLFNTPKIHLIVVIFTTIGWLYFNNCIITSYYNKLCDLPKNKLFNNFFIEIFEYIKELTNIPYLYYIYMLSLIIYDLFIIFIKNKIL